MSQTHRDDAGIVECGDALDCCASLHIVECGDALDCCASLQQSAEELAPTQLCASRGIWCVNCEDGVGRVGSAAPHRRRARRRRCTSVSGAEHPHPRRVPPKHRFHWPLHTGGNHGHRRLAGRSLLEGVDCDRHIAGLPNSPCAPPGHATLSRRQGSVVRYLRRCTCSTLGRSRLNRKGRVNRPSPRCGSSHSSIWNERCSEIAEAKRSLHYFREPR